MDKFEEEKLIIEYFRKCYTNFPKGRLLKSESPDFILKINHKKSFGIELTHLVQSELQLTEQIQFVLNKKQKKISLYQKGWFEQIWLIIHADQIKTYRNYSIRNRLEKATFHSDFDKAFVFDLFNNHVFQLAIDPI